MYKSHIIWYLILPFTKVLIFGTCRFFDECISDLSHYLLRLVTIDLSEEVHTENSCCRTEDCFHNCVNNLRLRTVNLASNMYLDDDSLMIFTFMSPNMEILDVCNQISYSKLDNSQGNKHIEKGAKLSKIKLITAWP
ncbi:hypothetical protein H5410_004069 [Solanum commersonii]|uniref:Uncharacterized protein n=1 Tax=Solanum commersonii TaxID=4109 RepID=A0A9J6B6Q3_SOLCO|nr:hypothetical protein H5410_004069 [Solanum commersonii]